MMSCNENETESSSSKGARGLKVRDVRHGGCWFLSERNCRMQLRKVVMTLD